MKIKEEFHALLCKRNRTCVSLCDERDARTNHPMRRSLAALPHVIAPPTRQSNLNRVQKPAEKGSATIVVARRLTMVYAAFEAEATLESCRALINQIIAGLSAEEPFVNVSSAAELLFYLERAASALERSVSRSQERGETKIAAFNYRRR